MTKKVAFSFSPVWAFSQSRVQMGARELRGSGTVVILVPNVRQAARREIRLVLPMRGACGNWSHGKTLAETDSNKIEDHVSVRFG